jgi:predicted DNA-binding protein YlxM (UPF0122 family)
MIYICFKQCNIVLFKYDKPFRVVLKVKTRTKLADQSYNRVYKNYVDLVGG